MNTYLLNALINNRKIHPEGGSPTAGRIREALAIACPEKAATILELHLSKILKTAGKNKFGVPLGLSTANAKKVAQVVARKLSSAQLKQFISLLNDSDFSTAEAIALHETFKIPVSHLEKDVVFVRAEGPWLFDTRGKKYLDMDSNYSATNLGNENKEIALGLFNQASQFISGKEDRVHIPRARFLSTIHQMMPKGLTQFYWQNSGGEAVDKSLKIAKAFTKQKGVIALKNGFHGRTHGAVAVTYNLDYRAPFFLDKEDWVNFVEPNDAAAVEELFRSGKARIIIMELVQSEEAGIRPLDVGFVKEVRSLCEKYGAVMICDEVQSGFGRCASKPGQWWASDAYGVVPDIMSIGKSFGGGYPVTAVVTKPHISAAMKGGYDGSTFGGNPMAMVAAFIATRQMREKNLTANVVARSKQFKKGLEALKKQFPKLIGDIRILGLMVGFELPDKEAVGRMQTYLKDYQIHTSLSTNNTMRLLPPLIISKQEVQFTLQGLKNSLAMLDAKRKN